MFGTLQAPLEFEYLVEQRSGLGVLALQDVHASEATLRAKIDETSPPVLITE
jgi:hypothetical protein